MDYPYIDYYENTWTGKFHVILHRKPISMTCERIKVLGRVERETEAILLIEEYKEEHYEKKKSVYCRAKR